MDPGAEHAAQPLRSDAECNRARIVAAARLVFGRGGLNSSMASVAREAGVVGIATLFRRFPIKEDLIAAVLLATRQATGSAGIAKQSRWRMNASPST